MLSFQRLDPERFSVRPAKQKKKKTAKKKEKKNALTMNQKMSAVTVASLSNSDILVQLHDCTTAGMRRYRYACVVVVAKESQRKFSIFGFRFERSIVFEFHTELSESWLLVAATSTQGAVVDLTFGLRTSLCGSIDLSFVFLDDMIEILIPLFAENSRWSEADDGMIFDGTLVGWSDAVRPSTDSLFVLASVNRGGDVVPDEAPLVRFTRAAEWKKPWIVGVPPHMLFVSQAKHESDRRLAISAYAKQLVAQQSAAKNGTNNTMQIDLAIVEADGSLLHELTTADNSNSSFHWEAEGPAEATLFARAGGSSLLDIDRRSSISGGSMDAPPIDESAPMHDVAATQSNMMDANFTAPRSARSVADVLISLTEKVSLQVQQDQQNHAAVMARLSAVEHSIASLARSPHNSDQVAPIVDPTLLVAVSRPRRASTTAVPSPREEHHARSPPNLASQAHFPDFSDEDDPLVCRSSPTALRSTPLPVVAYTSLALNGLGLDDNSTAPNHFGASQTGSAGLAFSSLDLAALHYPQARRDIDSQIVRIVAGFWSAKCWAALQW
jgi:hypothetical protein